MFSGGIFTIVDPGIDTSARADWDNDRSAFYRERSEFFGDTPAAGSGIGDWISANSSGISGGAAIAQGLFQIADSLIGYFSKKSEMEFKKDTIMSGIASQDRMTEANKTAQLDKEDRKVALARDLEKIQKEYNAATVQRKENEDKLQITVAELDSADKVDALKKETSKSIFDSRTRYSTGTPAVV